MSDPRIDPNYRGVKCKGCGEYLPFLFNRLCTHCALEAKDAEIERLRKERDVWKANAETNLGEVDSLIELLRREKVKVERLRGALERIAELYYPAEIQRIAREVLDE